VQPHKFLELGHGLGWDGLNRRICGLIHEWRGI
jgi:hypothetical protein